jgi:hypothetical protein
MLPPADVDGNLITEAEFVTPDGPFLGWPRELYLGLRGQLRICLVDRVGRVSHYDTDLVHPVGDPLIVEGRCRNPFPGVHAFSVKFRKVAA